MLPQFDLGFFPSQIFWLLVCFGLLFCFVNFYFFPRMQNILQKRESTITTENKIFEHNIKEMEALKEAHNKMIVDAKLSFNERIKKAEDEAKLFVSQKKSDIDGEFNQKFEDYKKEIISEMASFELNLKNEATKTAIQILEKIEGREINPEDIKNLSGGKH
jgi:F-type H+-transporting ATPase subunit b